MNLTDSVSLTGVRRTRDGYLVANARIARTGIYHYGGAELGKPELDVVRVYRPEDEVFDQAAMAGFAHRPITNDHPTEPVTSATWRDKAVGMIGGEIARDGAFLSVPLALMDGQTIADFEAGKREVSAGYSCEIEWTAGVSPDGEAYDAVQKKIRANHLAIVDRGRAGPECRIGDAARQPAVAHTSPTQTQGDKPVTAETQTRAVTIDGFRFSVSDQAADLIDRLQRKIADAQSVADAQRAENDQRIQALDGQIAALQAGHQAALEAKDGEIAALRTGHQAALEAKDGEIATLRAQTNDVALDQRVAARSALIAQARPILGDAFNPTGLSDAAIRKEVVVKALGANLVDADSKGDTFYDAAFATVMAMAPRAAAPQHDPLRSVIASGPLSAPGAVADGASQPTAWQANVQRLADAWKNPAKEIA